jgi:hypothetical protein
LSYFRVFRRHAALLVVAIEELCLLPGPQASLRAFDRSRGRPRKPTDLTLAPCLTTKSIGNNFKLTTEHHTFEALA